MAESQPPASLTPAGHNGEIVVARFGQTSSTGPSL